MSELEKQAKTVSQIMEEYNQLPDYVLQVEALEKQYVPFEFHQNKIGELENHFDDVIHDYNAVQKNLSEKVFTLETENKQLKEKIMNRAFDDCLDFNDPPSCAHCKPEQQAYCKTLLRNDCINLVRKEFDGFSASIECSKGLDFVQFKACKQCTEYTPKSTVANQSSSKES